mgnify:CR=1 FL=1
MYDRFRQLLDEKGITPYRVSKDTGISQVTLSDWKQGKSTPKLNKLLKIANYIGVPLDYLITESTPENGRAVWGDVENEK